MDKPVKVIISYFPGNISAQDIIVAILETVMSSV
jgi:hypothetical protein